MKTKKNNHPRYGIITLSILVVISIISCVIFSLIPGEDYTLGYNVYSEVKDITGTYALMDYCHENFIEYSINNNVFSMKGYATTFSLNKAECSITNDNHMNNLTLLEKGCYDIVENTDAGTVYTLRTWGTNYTLCDGNYTVYNTWPALFAFFAIIIFTVALTQQIYFTAILNRKNDGDNVTH